MNRTIVFLNNDTIVDKDWLVIFIFIGLLAAGLYAMGRSPLAAFDVTISSYLFLKALNTSGTSG